MDESLWVGRDEAEGIPAESRKDVKPPPHWRLEAVAATERPRSLVLGPDRRRALFVQDRETSDVWLLDLADAVPRRVTTGRDPMPFWEDTAPQLSPDGMHVAYAEGGAVKLVPRRRRAAADAARGGRLAAVDRRRDAARRPSSGPTTTRAGSR